MVKLHLYQKGFRPNYCYWTNHREEVVVNLPMYYMQKDCQNNWHENENVGVSQYEAMVMDVPGPSFVNDYT